MNFGSREYPNIHDGGIVFRKAVHSTEHETHPSQRSLIGHLETFRLMTL